MVESSKPSTIKFLCSYGGKILPRYPDGKLRYLGGETRVLAVDRSIPFSELQSKLAELCGASASLRCQLPTEDLDALVSITGDEDLINLIEEYDRASTLKIRAFLHRKTISPPSSCSASSSLSPRSPPPNPAAAHRCLRQIPPAPRNHKPASPAPGTKVPYCAYHHRHHHRDGGGGGRGSPSHSYLIHNGNHWQ